MSFFYLKALHIIFVVTWFAGLFYIVRLFIYHSEALKFENTKKEILCKQYTIMENRLWYIITWPSAILTLIFGPSLLHMYFPLTDHPWLLTKIAFVCFLFIYHLYCGKILKSLQKGIAYSGSKLRIFNEIATLFLFSIVFLVVLKDLINATQGLIGFMALSIILMLGIKVYKKYKSDT